MSRPEDSVLSQANLKSFKAILERSGPPLHWTIIRVPFDLRDAWQQRAGMKVKGSINGVPFRTSLFARNDQYVMIVNKRIQAAAHVSLGMVAAVTLEPDFEERTVEAPAELARILKQDRALRRWYDGLNYSTRADISNWITGVKSQEARERRAEQIAERLLSTMEAERELPPAIKLAFEQNARARRGWAAMSAVQRRRYLLAIFYYRDPASRTRRIAKVIQEAVRFGEKNAA